MGNLQGSNCVLSPYLFPLHALGLLLLEVLIPLLLHPLGLLPLPALFFLFLKRKRNNVTTRHCDLT